MIKNLPKPSSFILQWHITERCNWHCKHCYQHEDYIKEELSTEQLFNVLDQYLFLIKEWNFPSGWSVLNITGGEPFVRKDFLEFAERIGQHADMFRWGMLSNGSFITKNTAEKLKSFKIDHYQVSLEGAEKYNDEIRGKNSFKKVINSIKMLVEAGIKTEVSLTLTKNNVQDIPELARLLDDLGVCRLGTRRLIPHGRGSSFSDDMLEPQELKAYYLSVAEMNKKLRRKNSQLVIGIGCESGIFNDEPVRMRKNYCGLVDGRILVLMANGDVVPCRRLPVVVGNVLKQTLFEVYYSSDKLWEMRNLNNAHPFCQNCRNFKRCFGGAKCVTYCYANKLFIPDVQCWKFYKKLEKPEFFNRFKEEIKQEVKLHDLLKIERLQDEFFEERRIKSKIPRSRGIDLTFKCNNNCVFCYDQTRRKNISDKPLEQAKLEIIRLKKRNVKMVALQGSEATIYPYIFELIQFIKNEGLKFRLTTNARMFSYEDFTKKFVNMGLVQVYTSLHSHKAEVHDELTRVPGSFTQTVKGIKNLLNHGVEVEINTTIVKQNVRDLKNIAEFVSREFPKLSRIRFSFPYYKGVDINLEKWQNIMPSLSEVRKNLPEAMKIFRDKNIYSFIEKLPICGAPEYLQDFKPEDYVIEVNKKPQKCESCNYYNDNYCVGVSPVYLELYGEKDIFPLKN